MTRRRLPFIDKDLHIAFKAHCARADRSMASVLEKIIQEFLQEQSKTYTIVDPSKNAA